MAARSRFRFALAFSTPAWVLLAMSWAAWAAGPAMLLYQALLAALERVPALRYSPPAAPASSFHRACIRLHVPVQAVLLAFGLWLAAQPGQAWWAVLLLGWGVGGVTGSQGITFAHELGHSRSRADRVLAWLLMASVNYAHFMVEHYRGHHPRAATSADPASARRGETLWQFLPRTLAGSLASAWRLEARQLRQLRRGWLRSPLLWASAGQLALTAGIAAWLGPLALLFWLAQSCYAVFLLEAINYIEHYGLERHAGEPFGVQHAWNADHVVTNSVIANLQRHSSHHTQAWKPYAELEPLPEAPQLPTGYAGCLFLASVPRLWFQVMEPRLQQLDSARAGRLLQPG